MSISPLARRHRSFWFLISGWLLAAIVGAAMAGFVAWSGQRALAARLHDVGAQASALQSRLDRAAAAQRVLQGQLAVELSTREALEGTLRAMQSELGSAYEQIAFFDELMPPGPAGAIAVRGLTMRREGQRLDWRLLLTRQGAGGDPFKGRLEFQAYGPDPDAPPVVLLPAEAARSQPDGKNPDAGGEAILANDSPADAPADSARDLDVAFEHYDRKVGVLHIPPGLEPREIVVNVLQGNAVRATHRFELPDLATSG